MIKSIILNSNKLLLNTRSYSTGKMKIQTYTPVVYSKIGFNQRIQFGEIETSPNGSVKISHKVEIQPFSPQIVTKKEFVHNLTDVQVEEIKKLRETHTQKQLAEKFNTSKGVISKIAKCSAETRQKLIDNFQIKTPNVKDEYEVRQLRIKTWIQKNQQREYDLKVINAAEAYEREVYFRREKNYHNYLTGQENYDHIVNRNQKPTTIKKASNVPLTPEEKAAKIKALGQLRKRRFVSESTKAKEEMRRKKNKVEKRKQKRKEKREKEAASAAVEQ